GQALDPAVRPEQGVVQDLLADRALHGDQRRAVRGVVDRGLEALRARGELGGVDLGVDGVGDDQEVLRAQAVGDDVVDHAAVLGQQQRVLRPPHGHRRELPGQGVVEGVAGLRAAHVDLPHVAEVEDAGALPRRAVLREIRVVPHRHAPAGEVGERRTERLVDRLEGGAAQVLIGHGAPYSSRGGRRPASAAHGTRSRRPVRHLSVSQAHHTARARPLVHAPPDRPQEPGGAPSRHGPPTERPAVPPRAPSTVVRVTKEGTTEWPIRIRSPRLVIRPPGDADRDSVIRLMTDPVTREYLGGAVDYASRQALELSPLGLTWGRWVLALAEDDTMIGSITLG